ncbi:tyrosine-type recombinase/integrase [Microbaculum marinum]|uniref:Tyrosine-type recombinase/integrase n=1 Tax=Microbaculum marinum TaxID=1764581 RepID=A0AAW9RWS0_9HYPH
MRLTDISIRQLPLPPKGQKIYFDDALPSFGCRVSQGGTRSFVVQHGYDRRLITIGRYPAVSLAKAREEAKRLLAEQALGKFRPQSIAWGTGVQQFLEHCRSKNRPRTVSDYTRLLNRHFPFGRKRISEISPQDIHRRIDRLADRPSEQHHAFVAVKIFFNWAHTRHYVDENPCTRLVRRAPAAPRERVLSSTELAAAYRTALDGNDTFSSIVALLILTGQRRGEIAALRWQWIDEPGRTINIPSSATKNKRAHSYPYGDAAAAVLERLPRTGEYLFPASRSTSRDGKPTTVFNGWGKCKTDFDRTCRVDDWRLHDLRRTFATNLAALGTPPHITERLLNHVSGTISGVAAVYNRFQYLDEMRSAVVAYEEHLAKLLEQTE